MNDLRDAVRDFLHALRGESRFLTHELIPRLKSDEFVRIVYDVAEAGLAEGGSVMQEAWNLIVQNYRIFHSDEASSLRKCQSKIAAHLLYAFNAYLAPDRPESQRIPVASGYYHTHIGYFPGSTVIMTRLGYELTPDRGAFILRPVSRYDILDVLVKILVLEQELELVLRVVRRAANERIRVPLDVIFKVKCLPHNSLEAFWHALRDHPSVKRISPTTPPTTRPIDPVILPVITGTPPTSHHDDAITTGAVTTAGSEAATFPPLPPWPIPAAFTTTPSSHPSTHTSPIGPDWEAATSPRMPNRWMCRNCATVNSYTGSTCKECDLESFMITVSPVGVGVDSAVEECPECMFPISPGEDCPMCRNYTYGSTRAKTILYNPDTRF